MGARNGTVGLLLALGALVTAQPCVAADQPQWGERHTRNMVSSETGLPIAFDPATGANVAWSAPLGSNAYGSPIIANGNVYIGTNNAEPRDPRHDGDRGVLMCLNEADGTLVWQLVVPRIGGDNFLDWPNIAICSPPAVEGDRVYAFTNRCEVVCLDVKGMANGNDGPYTDEGRHMTPADQPPVEAGPLDADIVWLLDLREAVGMYPHDSPNAAILLDGEYLYLNTCNGVDNTHRVIRKPDAPSLIVVDKSTGKVVAQDAERIGPRIFHSTWSPPAMGTVDGAKRVYFCGGDGVCYAFEPLASSGDAVQPLKQIWRFDPDPTSPKEDVQRYLKNRDVSPSNMLSTPVLLGDRLYVTVGGDIWWGKNQAWLKCINATGTGDVTESGEVWSYPLVDRCVSTPAVSNGLVFVADCSGLVHCVDAATGQGYWTYKLKGDIWGSTLVADGKVFVGSQGRDFCVFEASKEMKLLSTVELDAPMASTPVAANGTLYLNTLKRLYALKVK